MVAKINADTSGGLKITSDTSGALDIQSAGTTKIAMDSSGNVSLAGNLAVTGLMPTGSIMQVIHAETGAQVTVTSGTYVDLGLSAAITPSATSSKIYVAFNIGGIFVSATAAGFAIIQLVRGSTVIAKSGYIVGALSSANEWSGASCAGFDLDSPSTTSAVTYKVQGAQVNGATINFQRDGAANIISSMILMEVAG
jgi:hypothetical protein